MKVKDTQQLSMHFKHPNVFERINFGDLLTKTKNHEIIGQNKWHDIYWGVKYVKNIIRLKKICWEFTDENL